jgi:hypothetical protein
MVPENIVNPYKLKISTGYLNGNKAFKRTKPSFSFNPSGRVGEATPPY